MKHHKLKVIGIVVMLLSSFILVRQLEAQKNPSGTITGQLKGTEGTIIKFDYFYNGKEYIDSATLKDDHFVFKFSLPQPLLCTLHNSVNNQIKIFIAQNRPISIHGEVDKYVNLSIENATENSLYEKFKSQELILSNNYREKIKTLKQSLRDTTTTSFHNYRKQIDSLVLQFIQKHNNSVASSLIILDNYVLNPNRKKASFNYQLLSEKIKKNEYGLKVKTYIEAVNNISIGKMAPNFTLLDTSGHKINLNNYKSKYVFLDFWASWCAPCRKQHPFLKKLFEKYKDKLVFISVSIDTDQQSWKNAIKMDSLPWTQVNSPSSMNNPVTEAYGIKSIPFNCFIDPKGKIVDIKLKEYHLSEIIKKRNL